MFGTFDLRYIYHGHYIGIIAIIALDFREQLLAGNLSNYVIKLINHHNPVCPPDSVLQFPRAKHRHDQ